MRRAGFTLIELLVAIAIAAILGALALPNLRRTLANAAVTSAASQALTALQLARRTALATGTTVTLCPTSDERICDMRGDSWMMFANGETGFASRREPAEPLLRRWPMPRGVVLTGTRGYAAYLSQPRAAATLTFTFCHPGDTARHRSVVVSQTGRARLSVPASTAGPSTCP